MDRELMIELLVDDTLRRARQGHGLIRLADMLREGFRGYGAFSDHDLTDEIECYGLATADANEDDGAGISDDEVSGLTRDPIRDDLTHY